MSRKNTPGTGPSKGGIPAPLTPNESCYLDGELTPQATRSMEHRLAADPARAAQLDAWRDAMDLWRDDTTRAAASVRADPDDLADRIIADRIIAGRIIADQGVADQGAADRTPAPGRRSVSPAVARWYAAAAAVLMAIGITGTTLVQTKAAGLGARQARPQVAEFEEIFRSMVAEGPAFAPPLTLSLKTPTPAGVSPEKEGR